MIKELKRKIRLSGILIEIRQAIIIGIVIKLIGSI